MPGSEGTRREEFRKISSVEIADRSSWSDCHFLTFDIDWAHDAVVMETVDLVERADIAATWFVTHDTPVLERLRANPNFELGLHPNFLPLLLEGDTSKGASAHDVLDRLLEVVPEAKSVRAHSLVQSGRLLEIYRDRGLTHECSAFIPENSGVALQPWTDWFGLIRVPYGWEDDFWFTQARDSNPVPPATCAIRGYDFHPIHVYLNTDAPETYEQARPFFQDPKAMVDQRNRKAKGAADCLRAILDRVV